MLAPAVSQSRSTIDSCVVRAVPSLAGGGQSTQGLCPLQEICGVLFSAAVLCAVVLCTFVLRVSCASNGKPKISAPVGLASGGLECSVAPGKHACMAHGERDPVLQAVMTNYNWMTNNLHDSGATWGRGCAVIDVDNGIDIRLTEQDSRHPGLKSKTRCHVAAQTTDTHPWLFQQQRGFPRLLGEEIKTRQTCHRRWDQGLMRRHLNRNSNLRRPRWATWIWRRTREK